MVDGHWTKPSTKQPFRGCRLILYVTTCYNFRLKATSIDAVNIPTTLQGDLHAVQNWEHNDRCFGVPMKQTVSTRKAVETLRSGFASEGKQGLVYGRTTLARKTKSTGIAEES